MQEVMQEESASAATGRHAPALRRRWQARPGAKQSLQQTGGETCPIHTIRAIKVAVMHARGVRGITRNSGEGGEAIAQFEAVVSATPGPQCGGCSAVSAMISDPANATRVEPAGGRGSAGRLPSQGRSGEGAVCPAWSRAAPHARGQWDGTNGCGQVMHSQPVLALAALREPRGPTPIPDPRQNTHTQQGHTHLGPAPCPHASGRGGQQHMRRPASQHPQAGRQRQPHRHAATQSCQKKSLLEI